jgi:hypothetical protein
MLSWLDGPLGALLLVVLVLGAVGWYLSYLAARLDRLHHRVESSRAALEARLARRAAVAVKVAGALPPPAGERLAASAGQVLHADEDRPEPPIDERAENELTRTLHASFADPAQVAELRADPRTADLLAELLTAGERVELARRFHNDAVNHAQRMRRKRVVRWAKLAGRAQMPQMVEIDDSPPLGLLVEV